jgi:hypothetical protein
MNKKNVWPSFLRKIAILLLVYLVFFGMPQRIFAQTNSPDIPFNNAHFNTTVITESVVVTIGLIGLHYLWYKKFPHSRFHFFNDNNEWLNMDKAGHATTAYNLSSIQYNMMRWSGVKNNQAIWIGGLTALGFQTLIEIFDGFSQKWGFSKMDMVANILGTTLFMSQQFAFNEQRIQLRFSFHHSIFSKLNPDELGSNNWQRWLKDYNGQTYWLSINPSLFMKGNNDFPKWLNAAVGYGAEGMIGASNNPPVINGKSIPYFKRYRQYYFSIDADLTRVGNTNGLSKALLSVPGIIKLPAPAIEFRKDSALKFHGIYF